MRLYWPSPNPPGEPKACLECETLVDGSETEGWWLERETCQNPNTYHLFCLSCCVEKMNEWSNHPSVDDEEAAKKHLYG
ncbi:hypothetical protein Htur_0437 [Haloterrigena turkmenica DSM 5511]|uniref:Uncharacterized protein n=1 Tax=Haloterrigena turkmenica (strain ATCC 51198 / DSM 5511 / JCM 9101 / NCIMB 13204 / VKM B-1734 / 4k) TaxID=543526 RepID=D2RVH1_HALTV|nr:hypothetical protein [Haloterrigena turkmenica]ADB59335.1 hypothetical protein Htur_0437 [Haloterrigena turkmenica DSM 5511]